MQDPNDTAGAALALVFAGIGLFILVLLMSQPVPASPSCMTQAEARARWPKAHLYWHTLARCWDNQRRPSTRAKEVMPTARSPFHEKPHPRWAGGVKIVRWQDFNELDAQADRDQYFRPDVMPLWPPLIAAPASNLQQRFIPWEERVR